MTLREVKRLKVNNYCQLLDYYNEIMEQLEVKCFSISGDRKMKGRRDEGIPAALFNFLVNRLCRLFMSVP